VLEVHDLTCGYHDGPDVLQGVSVEVGRGEVVALVGLNGAGKSTLVKAACGLIATRRGSVRFADEDVTSASCDARARKGLMLVPEGRELFATMSVAENLLLGMNPIPRRDRARRGNEAYERVFGLFPVLAQRKAQQAGTLSGGEQQMLAIGRALMSSPDLLVLDEPSLGLAPRMVESIFSVLRELNRSGLSILLVEQNAAIALDASHRSYLLELGRVVSSGASRDMLESGVLGDMVAGGKPGGTGPDEGGRVDRASVTAATLPEYSRADRQRRTRTR
jgi:ABC-type branched-subunit amino acid transport system ATPase component